MEKACAVATTATAAAAANRFAVGGNSTAAGPFGAGGNSSSARPFGPGGGQGTARIYRVYRHQPTEELIASLIRQALITPAAQLQDLLLENEKYVKARDYIKSVAKTLPFIEIAVPCHEAEWAAYKSKLVGPSTAGPEKKPRSAEIQEAIFNVRKALDQLEALLH